MQPLKTFTVLIVDDDPHIREVIKFTLETDGITVEEASDGLQALEKAKTIQPNIIILDVLMPELNGLETCRTIRSYSKVPIIFLSSQDDLGDKIDGLEAGGDDYLTKPFSPRELLARIRAMRRRFSPEEIQEAKTTSIQRYGPYQINGTTYTVTWNQQEVPLTVTEFNLFQTFLSEPNRVFSRDTLCQLDIFKDVISNRTVDSHIRRLRNKFMQLGCQDVIETMHGFGYKLGSGA